MYHAMCLFTPPTFVGCSLLFGPGAEAADRAQCAAHDKPIGYWNLLVVFANLKRVIQCACFKLLGSRKGTPKCNLRILAVAQHLPRKWRLVSSSSLQRGHNGLLTLSIIVRCRLRVLCPVRSTRGTQVIKRLRKTSYATVKSNKITEKLIQIEHIPRTSVFSLIY